ncbi:MAG: DNA adenine methylase [Pyrinomonadaceae bacterium]
MSGYRTPFRYPGGKQRLSPFVAELLQYNNAEGWNYVEPYAGGAGVAMELLVANKVGHVFLNDSSRHVYAVWRSLLYKTDEFCRRISRSSLSIDSWKAHRDVVRHPEAHDLMTLGFSTFYLNRCNRSGVLTAGVIGGQAQKGRWKIDARFPRNELIRRIETIAALRKRITITNMDAEHFMLERVNRLSPDTLVYCDPPYFERAARLYLNTYQPDDHKRLAGVIQRKLKRPWLVSYDRQPDIRTLYAARRTFSYTLQYSAMRSYAGREVFIFSDSLDIPPSSTVPYIDDAIGMIECSA